MVSSFTATLLYACLFILRGNGIYGIYIPEGYGQRSFNYANFTVDIDAPLKTVQSFCHATTCQASETNGRLNHPKNHCCIPCNCLDTCHAAGTCCADARETKNFNINEEYNISWSHCVKTSAGNLNDSLYANDMDRYILIQFCPGKWSENGRKEIMTKCLQPNQEKLDEIVPVYSNTTRQNYRNIYCAKCNNDSENSYNWETRLICESQYYGLLVIPSTGSMKFFLKHDKGPGLPFLKSCYLKLSPTLGAAQSCKLISSCSVIYGQNPNYETACREIYAPVRGIYGEYRNIFCLACNEDHKTCFSKGRDTANLDTLSIVLKPEVFTKKQLHRSRNTAGKCKDGRVYDNVLEECILKACPVTHIKTDDVCKPTISKVSGYSFSYRIKLFHPTANFKLPDKDKIFSVVRHLVLHDNDSKANLCSEEVQGLEHEGNNLVQTIKIIKTIRQLTSPHEDFKLFTDKMANFNKLATTGQFPFFVKVHDKMEYFDMHPGLINFVMDMDKEKQECWPIIPLNNAQFCDMVILKEEICNDRSVFNRKNGVKFYHGEYKISVEDDHIHNIYVCYNLYVSKVMKATGISSSTVHLSVSGICCLLMLTCTVFNCLSLLFVLSE